MQSYNEKMKVTPLGCLMLILGVLMFSGLLGNLPEPWTALRALDFNALAGLYGKINNGGNFQGSGGTGARGGFLFALSLFPSVIMALGLVNIIDGYGGLAAAQKLITPLFRPLFNIPGVCGLAFITHLQSTDGAAGMTKDLYDKGMISDKERTIFCMLQVSCPATITNYFSIYAGLFPLFAILGMPIALPIAIALVIKCMGAIIMRVIVTMDKTPDTRETPSGD